MDMKKEICGAVPKGVVAGFPATALFGGEKKAPPKGTPFQNDNYGEKPGFREAKTNPFRIRGLL